MELSKHLSNFSFYDTNRNFDQNAYDYTIFQEGSTITVNVVRKSDGAVKTFSVVGKSSVDDMRRHMNSLTDGQIEQFYPKERVKTKRKDL